MECVDLMSTLKANGKDKRSEQESCVHHWVIEVCKKPMSEGRCEKCQKVKSFENYVGGISKWNRRYSVPKDIAA